MLMGLNYYELNYAVGLIVAMAVMILMAYLAN
jgi:hypothetical protein